MMESETINYEKVNIFHIPGCLVLNAVYNIYVHIAISCIASLIIIRKYRNNNSTH